MKQSKNVIEKQAHFAIKKLSVGAAAVLVSTSMYLGVKSGSVSADTNNTPNAVVNIQTTADSSDQNATEEPATSKSSADSHALAQAKQTAAANKAEQLGSDALKADVNVPAQTKDTEKQTVTRTIDTQIEGQAPEFETKQSAEISRDRYWHEVESGLDHKDDTTLYRVYTGSGTIYGTSGNQSGSAQTIYTRSKIINYAYPEGDPRRITYTPWVQLDDNGNPEAGNPTQTYTSGWGDWSDWTTASFGAVTAPVKPGYTVTNPDAAPAVTDVTGDSTVTFVYTANDHTQVINYVDENNNNNVIATYNVDGKTGETKDTGIDSNVPDGYAIDGSYTATITFGANDPEPINVLVVKKQSSNGEELSQPEAPVEVVVVYQDSQTGEVVNTTEQAYKDGEKIGFDIPAGYEPTDKLPDLTATPNTGVIVIPVTKITSSTGTPDQTPDEPTNNAPHDQTPTNTPDDQPEKDVNTPVKAQHISTPKKNHNSKSHAAVMQHSNGNVKSRTVATQKQTVAASNTSADSKATLPQTGSKNNNLAAIGLGLAAMAGILSLLGFKKKEN